MLSTLPNYRRNWVGTDSVAVVEEVAVEVVDTVAADSVAVDSAAVVAE